MKEFVDNDLIFIPPELRLSVFLDLDKNREWLKGDILSKVMDANKDLKSKIHGYLQNELERVISDQVKAADLADRVIENEELLGLHHEHPLFQRAIEIKAITEIADTDRKNPYRLYQELKKASEEDFIPVTAPAVNKQFTLQFTTPSGEPFSTEQLESLSLNINALREKAVEKKGFTFGDLPQGVAPDSLNKLFESLNERLDHLTPKKREQAEQYIQENYNCSRQELEDNILEKPLIPGLLSLKGAPGDPIENSAVYLYATMKAILDSSTEVGKDSPLSPQETLLLSFSGAIRECSTGQRDGITGFYNLLPVNYRLTGRAVELGYKDIVNNLMEKSVQKVLGDVFLGDDLSRTLVGKADIEQAAHQTLYLQNRYSRQVGFQHRINFDPYTGVLYDEIIDAKPADALKLFFTLCTPDKVINQCKIDIAQAIESEEKLADAQLKEALEAYKKTDPQAARSIDAALNTYKKEGKRLVHVVMENPALFRQVKKAGIDVPVQTKLQSSLRNYFEGVISSKIKEKADWSQNYLTVLDDGMYYPLKGVTDLGAVELLKAARYFEARGL